MAVMLESPKRIAPSPAERVGPSRATVPSWTVLRWITVVVMGVLYLSSFSTRWWWTPDSALYLMLKDNLVAGEGFTLWGFPHLHVPPGFPLLLAMLEYAGLGTEWGRNLFMIGIGLGTIWLTYRVLLRITSPEMALLITAAFGYSHAMHFNTIRVLSDVPCMFFVWLGLWSWFSGLQDGGKKLELGTLCLLVACGIRVAVFPLVLGASAGLVLQPANVSRLRAWLNASVLPAIALTAAVGFFLYRATVYGSLPTYENELFRVLDWSAFDWVRRPFEHAVLTSWSLSEILMGQPNESLGLWMALIWIPVVFGIADHVRRKHFVLVFMFLAYCLPIMFLRDMLPRYLLPVAPLVLLFFFDGVRAACRRIPTLRPSAAMVPLVLAWLSICCNIPKTLGHWPHIHFGEECHRELEEAHKEVAAFLRANVREGDRFLSSAFHRNLSYRAGAWSLPIAKRRHANADDEFDYWKSRRVRFFVVFDKEFCRHRHYMQMYWHYDMMNDEFLQSKGLRVVFQREGCRVYADAGARQSIPSGDRNMSTRRKPSAREILGDEAVALLDHECNTISKAGLHLPGPDFIDRVFLHSDRSNRVMGNLTWLFKNGRLEGTGYLSVLPVDQGIEHTAGASFAPNPAYFDPENIIRLAIEGGCNAVASTLGVTGMVSRKYAHKIPFIVKINHNELLTYPNKYDQRLFANVDQAFDMGAAAVGATIYFGSEESSRQIEEVSAAFCRAHELGLATVLWCYLRNSAFKHDKTDYHTAADMTGQANHLGVTIEADIIKQKLPTVNGGFQAIGFGKYRPEMYDQLSSDHPIDLTRYQVANCYMGRIGLINSGGASGKDDLREAIRTAVINKRAGGTGLISGRKAFQRPMAEGVDLLNAIQDVYLDPEIGIA